MEQKTDQPILKLPKSLIINDSNSTVIKENELNNQYNDSTLVSALMGGDSTVRFKPVEQKNKRIRPHFSVPIRSIFTPEFLENAESALGLNKANSSLIEIEKNPQTVIPMEDIRFKASG